MVYSSASNTNLRRLPLSGAVNFRDLGGYCTADGRQVKWRHIYRSDSLAELTDADLQAVTTLGLHSLCDLRHESERDKKPNCLPDSVRIEVHTLGFFPHRGEELIAAVRARSLSSAAVVAHLREAYRRFPLEQLAAYSRILHVLLAPDALPALIHCTSGKDRTGFAAAVILMALGVPRETIIEDYLLTNLYRRDLAFMLGADVDPDVLAAITQAHPEYLLAAFATIDEVWGCGAAFIEEGLGFNLQARQRLQELLLESRPNPLLKTVEE